MVLKKPFVFCKRVYVTILVENLGNLSPLRWFSPKAPRYLA